MKTRAEIKETAKARFKNYYGMSLAVFIIFSIISAAVSSITFGLGLIVALPLSVGYLMFCVLVYNGTEAKLETMFNVGFGDNFARKLGGMLWMQLFTFLWSLLFIIPGIVKSYSYRMTPYILAKYPNVKAKDALKLSMLIMDGRKMDMFIFDLSFLGWHLLSSLTFGILEIFYVAPYMNTSLAGYYDEIMNDAIARGIITITE